ncbi:MAG: 30S ribosome-binding factor RbfA [Hymenobacteraceae bacterium]|nr:30S ribosome-binding factor RbfA [Hymenobacteraceae bacterium]
MSTESSRQQKFARLLQKELADLFLRDVPHLLPKGGMVSVQTVRMSPDLGQARVYLSVLLSPDPAALLALITENKSVIRKHLGERIRRQARIVPDLHFFLDDTASYAAHIEGLLNTLDIKPEEPGEQ